MQMATDGELYRDLLSLSAADATLSYSYVAKLEDETIRDALRVAFRNRSLVVVLGAGISIPSGLPAWTSLVRTAVNSFYEFGTDPDIAKGVLEGNRSPITQVRFFESVAKNKIAFRMFVYEALYKNYDENSNNELLTSLCSLILGSDHQ
jgi:NAD-dependent SIR2 family protein deacetylase